jgi:hypothetical protein
MSAARVGVDVLRGPTRGRNNSSASVDAMAVLNGRSEAQDRSSNARLSSSVPRSNSHPLRKPRENGRDAAVAGVVAALDPRELLRIRMPSRSSRSSLGLRASRGLHVRHKRRVRILRSRARTVERLAPRETAPSDGDASAGDGVVVVAVVPRALRRLRNVTEA